MFEVSPTLPVSDTSNQPPENIRSTDPILTVVRPVRHIETTKTVIVQVPQFIRERTVIVSEPPKQQVEVPMEKPEVEVIASLPENNSEAQPETIRPELTNNSPETIQNNSKRIESELNPRIEPTKPRQSIQFAPYKKVGKVVGRQRKYEEEGERGEIPICEVVVYRYVKGRHYPVLSKDMQRWYEFFYFTAPQTGEKPYNANTTYEQHVEAYKRGQKWIAASEGNQFGEEENNSVDAVEDSRIVDLQARRIAR